MLRALTTAATGMIAQQNYLDVIANNVANVNTTAFKNRISGFVISSNQNSGCVDEPGYLSAGWY